MGVLFGGEEGRHMAEISAFLEVIFLLIVEPFAESEVLPKFKFRQ